MCSFHLMSLSKTNPKYLVLSTLLIFIPFVLMFKFFGVLSHWLPNSIYTVLTVFNKSLFRANHLDIFRNKSFIFYSTLCHVLAVEITAVSSAYDTISFSGMSNNKSLMYSINSNGLNTVPCGTPIVTDSNLLVLLFSFTLCCLFVR